MKSRIEGQRLQSVWLLLAGVGLLVSACSLPLPQAQPDLTRYFVLRPAVKAPGEAAALSSLWSCCTSGGSSGLPTWCIAWAA